MLRRAIAAGCAAMVFALGLFAASPVLHEQLHHDTGLPFSDGCAVVLFSNGVSVPFAVVAPLPPTTDWHEHFAVETGEVFFASPRYLLQPERGPPLR